MNAPKNSPAYLALAMTAAAAVLPQSADAQACIGPGPMPQPNPGLDFCEDLMRNREVPMIGCDLECPSDSVVSHRKYLRSSGEFAKRVKVVLDDRTVRVFCRQRKNGKTTRISDISIRVDDNETLGDYERVGDDDIDPPDGNVDFMEECARDASRPLFDTCATYSEVQVLSGGESLTRPEEDLNDPKSPTSIYARTRFNALIAEVKAELQRKGLWNE